MCRPKKKEAEEDSPFVNPSPLFFLHEKGGGEKSRTRGKSGPKNGQTQNGNFIFGSSFSRSNE